MAPKLYIPSTLNFALILWHTKLILCAENDKSCFKSWLFPFTFQAYILPHTLNCMFVNCQSIQISCLNFRPVLVLPKTAGSAQTHKSMSFILIVWSTLYVYLWVYPEPPQYKSSQRQGQSTSYHNVVKPNMKQHFTEKIFFKDFFFLVFNHFLMVLYKCFSRSARYSIAILLRP